MRVYVRIREMMLTNKKLFLIMEQIENRITKQDEKITLIFHYLKKFKDTKESTRKQIGYKKKYEQSKSSKHL